MKKVCAVTAVLFVLVFVLAGMASAQASQSHWRVWIQADDGNGMNYYNGTTAGVYSSSTDGYGVDGPGSDSQDVRYSFATPPTPKSVAFVFGGQLWKNDIKSRRVPLDSAYAAGQPAPMDHTYGAPMYEPNYKMWEMKVFGYPPADTSTPIRVRFVTVAGTIQPPLTLPDASGTQHRTKYFVRMKDNKGVLGAPANGTVWEIPMPTSTLPDQTMFYSITLPTLNITLKDSAHVMSEAYGMQFYQMQVVPEPSTVMALAGGLMGLAGYALRRRKQQ